MMFTLHSSLTFGESIILSKIKLSFNSGNVMPQSNVLFPSLPIILNSSVHGICQDQSDTFLNHLNNNTLWAHEMQDATARIQSGVLSGNLYNLGDFDQCLTVKAPFKTQYCLVSITANVPKPPKSRDIYSLYHDPFENILEKMYPWVNTAQVPRNSIKLGWCIPASCSPKYLEKNLNHNFETIDTPLKQYNISYNAQINEITCQEYKETIPQFDIQDIFFCSLTIILLALVITSTCLDQGGQNLLMCFSVTRNFSELTHVDTSDSPMMIFYGIKTFYILMVILVHEFFLYIPFPLINFGYIEQQYKTASFQMFFHGDLFIDSFFALGGIMVSYQLLTQLNKRTLNPALVILMRYIRLTPVYAFVIFYYISIFDNLGSGPLWKMIVGQEVKDCKNNWWTNLLYLNNYINADHMCMIQAWYLPCDFHFFIIATFTCFIIKKNRNVGFGILSCLIVVSTLIPICITWAYERPAFALFLPSLLMAPKSNFDFLLTYVKSHTRAGAYFVGVAVGCLYYKRHGTNKRISKVKSHLILIISVLSIIAMVSGGVIFYNPYHEYNAVEAAIYAGLSRPIFALGTLGVLFATSYGHVDYLYHLLSWKPLIPLSKLAYSAYLIHKQFQLMAAGRIRNPRFFSYINVISSALSNMVLAFVVALCLYLMIEVPLRKMFKILIMNEKVKPKKSFMLENRENDQSSENF